MRISIARWLLLSLLLGFVPLTPSTVHATGWVINGDDNLEVTVGQSLAIDGISITGSTGDVPVKLLVSNGTLAMSTTTGLTFTGDEEGAELYFSGDVDDVNAALATLTYEPDGAGADQLEISLVEQGEVFFSDNTHLYEYISVGGGITWTDAKAAAELLERYGASGYLATITSEAENDFVADRLEGAGWMGASDAASEDTWEWVTGPETGDDFWLGDQDGEVVPGAYENWNNGEPNDSGSNEDCGQFLSGASGLWNDLPCTVTTLTGYVVEFGAPGDLPETTGEEFTITAYNAPTVSTLSPTDNATDVSSIADLVITFSAAVDAESGNITIYRSSDDSAIATIDVTSGLVTGSGTETITINPETPLPKGQDLYVQIDSTAFDASAGGSFAGIANETTWNFTTESPRSSIVADPITSVMLDVVRVMPSCEAQHEIVIRIGAQGADEYIVSNEPLFLNSNWQTFTGPAMDMSWMLDQEISIQTLYVMLRSNNGATAFTSTQIVIESQNCEEEEVDIQHTENDETERDQEGMRTGPSPWNGKIELISNTHEGMLIKGQNYDTVYLIEDGSRRPFVHEHIYYTWHEDFDDIVIVTDATLATIPLGPPMLPRSGVVLVKIQSIPTVYWIRVDGAQMILQEIASEIVARDWFGENWADYVIDVPVTLFRYYIMGDSINTGNMPVIDIKTMKKRLELGA